MSRGEKKGSAHVQTPRSGGKNEQGGSNGSDVVPHPNSSQIGMHFPSGHPADSPSQRP